MTCTNQNKDVKRITCVVTNDDLYKRGFSTPLFKFISQEKAQYIMNELYNGVCACISVGELWKHKSYKRNTHGQRSRSTARNLLEGAIDAKSMETKSRHQLQSYLTLSPPDRSLEGNGHCQPTVNTLQAHQIVQVI